MTKETIPTCNTCALKKSRLEMVAPSVSGMVDYCKEGVDIEFKPFPTRCGLYNKNIITKIKDLIK